MPGSVCIFQQFMPPDPSGAGKQALTLAHVLRDAGWNVVLLTEDRQEQGPVGELEGFPVRRVRPLPSDPTLPQVLAYWARLARQLTALRSRFDILHVHSVHFYQMGAVVAAKMLGRRVLIRSSIAGDFTGLDASRTGRVRRRIAGMADAVVVLSDQVKDEYVASGLPVDGRLVRIPNGVDTRLYHPVSADVRLELRRELGLPRNGRILIYHGVFIERKAIDWALDVLEPLLARLDLTVLLVGGPAREEPRTGYAARLMERIERSPVTERIIVRPFAPDVFRYLQAADAYMLPSRGEGMSNALLEAMAVGLVPFVTRASGSEDAIEHGVSGFLFDAGDAAAFGDAVSRTLDASAAADMGSIAAAAARRIQEKFSIVATGRQYADVYERLIA